MFDPAIEKETQHLFKLISLICSLLAGVIALLALLGWLFNITFLKSISPHFIAMKPNAVIMFILACFALVLLQDATNRLYGLYANVLAVLIIMIASLTLIEHAFNIDLYIDQFLFVESPGPTVFYAPGRIAPVTAMIFLFVGLDLLFVDTKIPIILTQLLAFFIGIFGIFILTAYVSQTLITMQIATYIYAALHAAINFILIAIAINFLRPDKGIISLLTTDSNGAHVARMFFPFAIVIPAIIGYLLIFMYVHGWFDVDTTFSFYITITVATVISFIFFILYQLLKADKKSMILSKKLETSELRWKYALESGNQGVWDWNVVNNDVYYSPMYKTILGYTQDIVVKGFDAFKSSLHPDDAEKTLKGLYDHIAGKTPDYISEHRMRCADGTYKWVLDRGRVIERNAQNEPLRALGTITDINQLKQTEENLKVTRNRLENSNIELQQFAYVASHDLREPLRTVESYTQLLARRYQDRLDNDGKEFMNFITDAVFRMQQLIDDLLVYSRITTKAKPFKLADANAILQKVLFDLQVQIQEKHAEIIVDHILPSITSDEIQIAQVLRNLISNSIKFCDVAPVIHVGAREEEHQWVFYVKDNGIGIEPQYFDRIFVIFQRLNPSSKYPGTGIGLATCKKIIQRHGGNIWLESNKGEGTTFYFTIPKEDGMI